MWPSTGSLARTDGRGRRTPWPILVYYALPAFALALPTIPVYVYLPTFYAEDVGLGLTATGAVLLAARLLDGITDPLVGSVSDRFSTRWGRRKPWILFGSVLAAAGLIQLFQPSADAGISYLLVWVVVLYIGWTLVMVPYAAWGAELSEDYHERARITGAREAAMIFGVLAAGAVPAAAAALGADERTGLATVSWLAITFGLPVIVLLLARVPEPAPSSRGDRVRVETRFRAIADAARNGPFLRLLSGWFVNGLANGFPAVLFPLYLQYGLQVGAEVRGLLIMIYFLAGVAAIPLWLRLSRRRGKHRTWCIAMALACAAFVWVPLLAPGDVWLFALICIVTGAALGADLALPPAMQADVVDLDTLRTGRRRAGLFFALWSMATKAALACAVGIAFPLLDLFGFDVGVAGGGVAGGGMANGGMVNGGAINEGGILALVLLYAGVPTALKILAIGLIWGHPLTARRQRIIGRRLHARMERAMAGGGNS